MDGKMDRRSFLRLTAATAATAIVVPPLAAGPRRKTEKTRLCVSDYVTEPSRKIPVVASTDILVVGGGPSGVAAAISAAREGAQVMLVEKCGYLGGLWTGGLVLPVLATSGLGPDGTWTKAVQGICTEICRRIADIGMCTHPYDTKSPRVDPEATKYILGEMIAEAGVRLLYYSSASEVVMSGDRIDSVILECKSGRVAVRCRAVVDCSGDGDIFYRAGDPFTEMKYQIGTMHLLGNMDRIDESAPGFQRQKTGSATPNRSVRLMHSVGELDQDGLDIFNLSRLQAKYRKTTWENVQALREKPGYGEVYLVQMAEQLGVRVTRVLDALHRVTLEESMTGTRYDDVIGMSGACDTHIVFRGEKVPVKRRPIWQIPYRSLVPRRTQNLLVAGRCFSFDRAVAYDAREIGTCFVTGQAAGVASALSVAGRLASSEVDISALQARLRAAGARLDF